MGRITENGFLDCSQDESYQYHEPTLQKPFCLLFEGNVCAALLLDVIEEKYFATKRFGRGSEYKRQGRYWFRASVEEFCKYYLSGMFSPTRVYDEVNDLLVHGYVLYEPDGDRLFEDEHWWSLGVDALNSAFSRIGWTEKYRVRESYERGEGGENNQTGGDDEPSPGFVYVASNPSIEGYKVGYTTQNIGARLKQLSRPPSIPTPFKCEYKAKCSDPVRAEGLTHDRLSDVRVSESSEFFDCQLDRIKRSVNQAVRAIDGTQRSD